MLNSIFIEDNQLSPQIDSKMTKFKPLATLAGC